MQDTPIQDPCLIFSMELDGVGGADPINATTSDDPCWLHVDYSHPTAEKWLSDAGLPSTVVEALVRLETRPRTLSYTEGALVCVRGANSNPTSLV